MSDRNKQRHSGAMRYFQHMALRGRCECEVCGWKMPEGLRAMAFAPSQLRILEVHHIVPVMAGGTDTLENMILLCPNHHRIADVVAGMTKLGSKRTTGITERSALIDCLQRLDRGEAIEDHSQADVTNLLSDLLRER